MTDAAHSNSDLGDADRSSLSFGASDTTRVDELNAGRPVRRPTIAAKWWVDHTLCVHTGQRNVAVLGGEPDAVDGVPSSCIATGWISLDNASGMIELSTIGVTPELLDAIDGRFPGRRWFEGAWFAQRELDEDNGYRTAA